MPSEQDEIYRLELLSLVSKISNELLNHTGINDRVLAEFILSLHDDARSLAEFKAALQGVGASFPDSFVQSLDRLIMALHPKHKKSNAAASSSAAAGGAPAPASSSNKTESMSAEEKQLDAEKERQRRMYPGLALADSGWAAPREDSQEEIEQRRRAQLKMQEEEERRKEALGGGGAGRDDTMRDLERLADRNGRGEEDAPKRRWGKRESPDYHAGKRRDSRSPPRRNGDRYDAPPPVRGRDERPRQGPGGYGRQALDDKPVLYKIYSGKVSGMKDFGAFVSLEGVQGRHEGMVHIGSIGGSRLTHPSEALSRGQPVKVKVMSVAGNRLGLSMKDVDQATGKDLSPHLRLKTEDELAAEREKLNARAMTGSNMAPLGRRGDGGKAPPSFEDDAPGSNTAKRLTSPERWELKQLIASGVAKASDYPELMEEETFATPASNRAGMNNPDEEVDIEVNEREAPFLAGQTGASLELSPVKIVKAPDGALNRAALAGASLAKERRELKQQEINDEADAEARDMSSGWNDPMAQQGDRTFAMDRRGEILGQKASDQPAWKKETFNKATTFGKVTSLSIQEQRQSLPIFKLRQELIQAIKDNQVLIVVGDTGSGKTTQMCQYLAEEGFADRGKIGCTQPRRVAAVSVAKRVAEEVGCRVGQEVGYTIRFEDCTSPETRIKYMTDGMLQRECLIDPDASQYSVIVLDEAHERTIATDVLFGLLKKTLKRRPEMKLIVTSATLDAEKFSSYFFDCPIFTIPGRTYKVEVLYTKEPESDYLDAALITVMQIHLSEPPGDILVFLTGQEEIDTSCEILFERMRALGPSVPELLILPVYSALPSEMQTRIFEPAPPGARKVVLATNIAETSITIDGVYYVIDPGFVKQNAYDARLGMDSLVVTPISQAQARQRAGRAGRTGPGKCYRLYTEAAYRNEMLPNPIPDIQRQNLASTILMLKAMGINDLINFDFMDPPPAQTLLTALEALYALSALDDEGLLTRLGRKMADFPMEPQQAKMLIASVDLGCSEECLSIIAMLSVQNVFYRPKEKQAQADAKKAKFFQPEGDHLTLLTVYNGWAASKFSLPWCMDNFVQGRSMRRAQDVRKQLLGIMDRYSHDIISCGKNFNRVRRAICSGFFRNAAKKDPQEGYKCLAEGGGTVYIHPSSSLFNRAPEMVIYHEVVLTTREYMRECCAIEPKWLVEVAPRYFRQADPSQISKRKRAEKVQPLFDKYAEHQDAWRISKVKRAGRGTVTFG
ncbi:P-loop containing nucleoside triphosphate hydrolase protein [Ceraceosorus guamensis]|uniref:RNA helicase n=1 Tax=Ceraceosorus guamensis TaxID=1522189 RepID=A0A316VN52_9BASI|nr:P-loop containing nucleoside triphosphate hydrolase protein [Ceraceosorus guamensis]PWN39059.1 P-loop containing nucleoside triphosphate hydrolase protein [Ceraceosorus guamensis]